MDLKETLIKSPGAVWQHRFLNQLLHRRRFPAQVRLFNVLRRAWHIDLLQFETPSGLNLLLDFNDWVQSQIYYFGNYEVKSVSLFTQLAKDASVIFDIGAHIGQYALECAQADTARSKKIFAIEVNPKTFAYLLNNIQINGFTNVQAVLGAVSAQSDILNIAIPAYWNMGNTQVSEEDCNIRLNNYLASSFSITTLLTKYELPTIDLIKMDVEGQETAVLKTLFQDNIFPTNIIFEFIPDAYKQSVELLELLKSFRYNVRDIDGNTYTDQKKVIEQNLWAQKI